MARNIITVDFVADPHRTALYASAVLAADKGIPSSIERNDCNGYDVITDDNNVFRFCGK